MSTAQGAFLVLLFSGIVCLLVVIALMRAHWRDDIPPYGRGTRLPSLLWRPERYTRHAPLRLVRILSLAGTVLLVGASAVLVVTLALTNRPR